MKEKTKITEEEGIKEDDDRFINWLDNQIEDLESEKELHGKTERIRTRLSVLKEVKENYVTSVQPKDLASLASHTCTIGNSIQEWHDECERLAGLAEYWQKKYYEVVPPQQPAKLDNL